MTHLSLKSIDETLKKARNDRASQKANLDLLIKRNAAPALIRDQKKSIFYLDIKIKNNLKHILEMTHVKSSSSI